VGDRNAELFRGKHEKKVIVLSSRNKKQQEPRGSCFPLLGGGERERRFEIQSQKKKNPGRTFTGIILRG